MPEFIVRLGDCEVQRLPLLAGDFAIGRGKDNDLVVNNLNVSRHHARIMQRNGSLVLADLGSTQGTTLNGVRVHRALLYHNDILAIGRHRITVDAPEYPAPESPASESLPCATLVVRPPRSRARIYRIAQPLTRIGRAPDNTIRTSDWFVDAYQAVIEQTPSGYLLRNIGSGSIRVNGNLCSESLLADRYLIRLGMTEITFSLQDEAAERGEGTRVPSELEPEDLSRLGLDHLAPSEDEEDPEGLYQQAEIELAVDISIDDVPMLEEEPEDEPTREEEPVSEEIPADIWPDDEELVAAIAPADDSEPIPFVLPDDFDLPEPTRDPDPSSPTDSSPTNPDSLQPAQEHEEPPAPEPNLVLDDVKETEPSPDAAAIARWERALGNKSLAVRKQAALQLSKLTGRAYEP